MLTGSNSQPSSRTSTRGRSPAAKDRPRIAPLTPTKSALAAPSRMDGCACVRPFSRGRRRVLFSLLGLVLLFLFLFSPSHDLFGLPPALQGLRRVSPASIAALMKPRVTEIHGLLYYAVHESEGLAHDAPDPTRPLDLSVYADGNPAPKPDWPARVKHLDEEAPLIVFSKVRPCRFIVFDSRDS